MDKNDKNIIAIHQPNYIPWLGFFYKIYQSDIFVFHDDVQFSKKGMHNFVYIKTPEGLSRLKFPVQQSHGDLINEVRPKDELKWKEKHISIIESNYFKSNYFKVVIKDLKEVLFQNHTDISSLNISLIEFFAKRLGIGNKFVVASELNIKKTKEEKVIALCNALGSQIYYSGTGARAYQKEENFISAGLELQYSQFKPFKYPQLWGEFQSNVSAIDYFMNCGYDWERVMVNQD